MNPGKDEARMRQALRLAAKARGRTSPNPLVGALVYKGEELVGKGYHRAAGRPHAEAEALDQAGPRARGATLYVTLEPCNHYGRTPPCTEAVIRSGVKRVVIGMNDPNPHVKGGGVQRLREAGLQVECGVLEQECRRLNEAYINFVTKGRPLVIVKMAATMDGKTATPGGDSKWITSQESRRFVHRLRSWVDAVMVGAGTVLRDDPRLTCRLPRGGRDPVRIIADSRLLVPPQAGVFHQDSPAPTWVAALKDAPPERAALLEAAGARILRVKGRQEGVDLEDLLQTLGWENITSLLVEGGMTLNASFFRARLVDKVYFFYAPKIMGGQQSLGMVGDLGVETVDRCIRLERVRARRMGPDIMIEAYPVYEGPDSPTEG